MICIAYIKIFPIKSTVEKAVKYITNPKKTDENLLISSYGCSPETATFEFALTRDIANKNVSDHTGNLAWHLIQSFKPGEVNATTAHEIGKRFADSVLKGKYEYVISTHIDKGHVHNHILFNATSFVDHHKYRSCKNNIHHLCRISNLICQENGLSVSSPTGSKSRLYKENMEYISGKSWKAKLKVTIDKAIWSSISFEEFLIKMKQAGYEIRQGKQLAFRASEQKHFTNVKTLGSYYTDEKIFYRISQNRNKINNPINITSDVRLFIDISSYIQTGNRPGFEYWAKRNNLQEAAKTFNYLSEHNLLNYEDFQNHITDINNSLQSAKNYLTKINSDLHTQKLIKKHSTTYRIVKQKIQKEKNSGISKSNNHQFSSEHILLQSLKKELLALGINKLQNPNQLDQVITILEKKQSKTQKEIQNLEKQQKTLNIIEQNFKQILFLSIPNNDTKHQRAEQQ